MRPDNAVQPGTVRGVTDLYALSSVATAVRALAPVRAGYKLPATGYTPATSPAPPGTDLLRSYTTARSPFRSD